MKIAKFLIIFLSISITYASLPVSGVMQRFKGNLTKVINAHQAGEINLRVAAMAAYLLDANDADGYLPTIVAKNANDNSITSDLAAVTVGKDINDYAHAFDQAASFIDAGEMSASDREAVQGLFLRLLPLAEQQNILSQLSADELNQVDANIDKILQAQNLTDNTYLRSLILYAFKLTDETKRNDLLTRIEAKAGNSYASLLSGAESAAVTLNINSFANAFAMIAGVLDSSNMSNLDKNRSIKSISISTLPPSEQQLALANQTTEQQQQNLNNLEANIRKIIENSFEGSINLRTAAIAIQLLNPQNKEELFNLIRARPDFKESDLQNLADAALNTDISVVANIIASAVDTIDAPNMTPAGRNETVTEILLAALPDTERVAFQNAAANTNNQNGGANGNGGNGNNGGGSGQAQMGGPTGEEVLGPGEIAITSEPYRKGCELNHRPRATCYEKGLGVTQCRRSQFPTEDLTGGGYHYAVIKCGGPPPDVPEACRHRAAKQYVSRNPVHVCRTHEQLGLSFEAALACYGKDVREIMTGDGTNPGFCEIGCSGKPNIDFCLWTPFEFKNYRYCVLFDGSIDGEYNGVCRGSQDIVNPELGNPPIISMTGRKAKGADGSKLYNVFVHGGGAGYRPEVRIAVSGVRRGGRYILKKDGNEIQAESFSETKIKLEVAEIGDYELFVENNGWANNKSVQKLSNTQNFSIVEASHDGKFCNAKRGFYCKRISGVMQQMEQYYACGENKDLVTASGWTMFGKNHIRQTGDTCQGWERARDQQIAMTEQIAQSDGLMFVGDFTLAEKPKFDLKLERGPVSENGQTNWTHLISVRPHTREVMNITTTAVSPNFYTPGSQPCDINSGPRTITKSFNFADEPNTLFAGGDRAGLRDEQCKEFNLITDAEFKFNQQECQQLDEYNTAVNEGVAEADLPAQPARRKFTVDIKVCHDEESTKVFHRVNNGDFKEHTGEWEAHNGGN